MVNSYFLSSTFFFKTLRCDMKKRGTSLWNYKFYTLWTPFRRFFFFLSCGQFDQWSTSWFCCSPPVLWGLQVKPPFHQPGRSRMKATLRSWLNRTSAVFLLHAAFLSPPDLQRNIVLCFSLFFVIASVLVFLFCNMMSVVQLWGSILEIQKWLLVSPLNKFWLQTFTWLIYLVRFSAFAILERSERTHDFPLVFLFSKK